MWKKTYNNERTRIKKTIIGIMGMVFLFYLVSCSATEDTSPSGGEGTRTPSLPGQVRALTVSDPSYNEASNTSGFKVSWRAPMNTGISSNGKVSVLIGYEIAYAEGVNVFPREYTSVTNEGTDTEHVFSNLDPGTGYDIRVQAKTAVGLGPPNYATGWTPSLPGAVDPDSILFSRATSSTIRIKWSAPEQGRAGGDSDDITTTLYKVEMSSNNGQSYTLIQDDYSNPVIFASNLSKSTIYLARITAKNKWGEVVSVSTATGATVEQDPTPPSAVRNLKVDSLTDTEVVLSWTAPSDLGTTNGTTPATLFGYVVKYKKTADSEFTEINHIGREGVRLVTALTGTTATVIGWDENTSYTFLVVAVNSADAVGLDEDAPTVEQTTAPAPPGSLRKINTCDKATSVDLAWDASPGATSYKLYQGDAEIINSDTNSYTDTGLTPGNRYIYKVQACSTVGCSGDSDSLTITTLSDKSFKSIIDSGEVPTDLTGYDERSQEIFSYFQGNAGDPLVAKYLKPGGAGTNDGSSFDDAAENLKTILDGIIINPVSVKVYFIFLTGGNYKAKGEMTMKNYTAIIGGVDECLNPSDTVTALDGDGRHRVFNNVGIFSALFYEVTVINGYADQGGGMYNTSGSAPILVKVTFSGNSANDGGGMYNDNSSPSLKWVAFSGNNATGLGGGMYNISTSSPSLEGVIFSNNNAVNGGGGMYNQNSSPSLHGGSFSSNNMANQGGGMYNLSSSPSLDRVVFSGNTATSDGGGMYNKASFPSLVGVTFSGNHATGRGGAGGGMYNFGSSPILEGVTFSENTAGRQGGGMHNFGSSPILEGVTFSENTTDKQGGGMFNRESSPILVGVTFSGNHATNYGGGMYNNNNGKPGPRIINGIFWGNTASTDGSQFYFENYNNAQENLHIYNSIVEGGVGTLVSGTPYTNLNQGGFVSGGGPDSSKRTDPVVISFSNIIATDPGLGELADNGGEVLTHAITSTSPAKDKGLYVRRKDNTFYYSEDNSVWYTEPDLKEGVIPPGGTVDLTDTDATGYMRTKEKDGRPDLGAYEAR